MVMVEIMVKIHSKHTFHMYVNINQKIEWLLIQFDVESLNVKY